MDTTPRPTPSAPPTEQPRADAATAAAVNTAGQLAVTTSPVVPAGLALRHAARARVGGWR